MRIIERYIEEAAGFLLILISSIYVSGFIIVNAYLSEFHVVQVEIFQPAFITAGSLFLFIISICIVIVLPLARGITIILGGFQARLREVPIRDLPLMQAVRHPATRENISYLLITLLLIASVMYVGFLLEEHIGAAVIVRLAEWASRDPSSQAYRDAETVVIAIAKLQGLIAVPFFLLYQNRKRIGKITRDLILTTSIVAALSVEAYSLLLFADKVYDKLPTTIGGGQPENVIFYVTATNAQYLDSIDDTFAATEALIKEDRQASNTSLIGTKRLILYWQIKQLSLRGDDQAEAYFVRPEDCLRCPIVKIYGSNVYSVVFVDP